MDYVGTGQSSMDGVVSQAMATESALSLSANQSMLTSRVHIGATHAIVCNADLCAKAEPHSNTELFVRKPQTQGA